MNPALFVRIAAAAIAVTVAPLEAQRITTGDLAGTVVTQDGKSAGQTTVQISRNDGTQPQSATTDAEGNFRIRGLEAGLYKVNARRIGFREANLQSLRIISGQTTEVRIVLTASPTQLSTVEVRVTATSIDPTTTEIARRLEVANVELVPMGRDANSLIALVPGAAKGFVWGGASDATNNYKLDGVSVNHPGTGGDFLSPSIDWIEALEVRGLGAGAEYGDFQGGIINAVTRTGTNDWRGTLRANYISPSLTGTNIQPNEEGAEQSKRQELSGEMSGPLVKDRLFYFVGGLLLNRDIAVPDLTTVVLDDTRPVQQEFRDKRGIAKLTYRPGATDRIDALVSHTDGKVEHAELNGLDDPSGALKVSSPTTFYELAWAHATATSSLDARIAGFDSRENRLGYEGDDIPGVRIFTRGRQPIFQNSPFSLRVEPRSIGGNVTWKKQHGLGRGENKIALGIEYNRGYWQADRTRNGGLTWLPYVDPATRTVDPTDAPRWLEVASEWGGEMHVNSDVENLGVFLQDYLTIVPNITITPGIRFGRWSGWLTPFNSDQGRFLAARDQAIEPRIGVVWDVTRRNDFVVKAHWGQFHQAMNSVFFDRAAGGNVYTNQRFYLQGPMLESSRRVYTPAERDAKLASPDGFSSDVFSATYQESILNEEGVVENYKQPYIQQAVLAVEKRFGPRWKAELSYTNRINKNIVGLVDRNLDTNYSPLRDISVKDRVTGETVFDEYGDPLIIPVLWVSNKDLVTFYSTKRNLPFRNQQPPPGYTFDSIDRLTFDQDIALTTVKRARRQFNQLSAVIRTEQAHWNGFASATYTRLRGNIPGLNGFGTTGTEFSAGSAVRPNEATNAEGYLANYPSFETKVGIGGDLLYGIRGGVFATYSLGNYFAPSFQISPRFRFLTSEAVLLNDSIFNGVLGQTILLEPRGDRKYQSRLNLDLRAEKEFATRGLKWIVTADLFNATASDAIIERNLTINDQVNTDPTSIFAAPRRRVNPTALQVGFRLEF